MLGHYDYSLSGTNGFVALLGIHAGLRV